MILTDKDILAATKTETPLIDPFDERRLSGTSYDLTLGSTIREINASSGVVYLSNQDSLESLYVERDITNGFILKPGQYVLCAIAEKITLPDDVVARLMPRTRFTRMGLLVANQFCNASYTGNLQIGLHNASPNNISIVEGLAVTQIIFEKLDDVPSDNRLYRRRREAVYQGEAKNEFRGARFDENELTDRVKSILDSLASQ